MYQFVQGQEVDSMYSESPFSQLASQVAGPEPTSEDQEEILDPPVQQIGAYYPSPHSPQAPDLPPIRVKQPKPLPPPKPPVRSLESLLLEDAVPSQQHTHRRAFNPTPAGLEVRF